MNGLFVNVAVSRWMPLPKQCKNSCIYQKVHEKFSRKYCFVASLDSQSQCAAVEQIEEGGSGYESETGSGSNPDNGSLGSGSFEAGSDGSGSDIGSDGSGSENSGSGSGESPVSVGNGSGSGSNTAENPCSGFPDNSFLPHPKDCRKFYHCDFGHPVEKICGPGTLWNPKATACDWPANVNCKD